MVGKIEPVNLRELWKHEAHDFTSWLFENIDILNDQLNFSLEPLEHFIPILCAYSIILE